jgi:hypothetical protein
MRGKKRGRIIALSLLMTDFRRRHSFTPRTCAAKKSKSGW